MQQKSRSFDIHGHWRSQELQLCWVTLGKASPAPACLLLRWLEGNVSHNSTHTVLRSQSRKIFEVLIIFQRQGRIFFLLLLYFILNLEDIFWDITSKLALEPVFLHAVSDDFPAHYEAVGALLKGAALPVTHKSQLLISHSRILTSYTCRQCRAGTTTRSHSKHSLSPTGEFHCSATRIPPSPERYCWHIGQIDRFLW